MNQEKSDSKMICRQEGAIGKIIFNNPERHNAVSFDMWESAERMLAELLENDDVHVIVLAGAGGKAFVSGADISKFESERATRDAVLAYNEKTAAVYGGVHQASKPTIAMIQGHCIGGGLGLAVSCDIRICTTKSKFGLPAAKLGLGYPYDGLKRLSHAVGLAYAKDICYTGKIFDADHASKIGLVQAVLSDDEIESYVQDYADSIAKNAPMTVRSMKNIFNNIAREAKDRELEVCQELVDACFSSNDYVEGRTAFMEKRPPVFTGT